MNYPCKSAFGTPVLGSQYHEYPLNLASRLAFLWLAVPYLQKELDNWATQQNITSRRANKNKILPHGIPHLILTQPDSFNNVKQFKVFQFLLSSENLRANVAGTGDCSR